MITIPLLLALIPNIIIGGLAILLLLIQFYNHFFSKKRLGRSLKAMQKELFQKNELLQAVTAEKSQLAQEKEWLLKEFHHRVKNNLQVVLSVLNTQSYYLKNGAALNAIYKSQQRTYAISLIHLNVYQSETLARLNIRNYIYDLVESIKDSLGAGPHIHFNIEVEDILLDAAQGAPLGLIMNEAITNAVEYAFPARAGGEISIRLVHAEHKNHYLLTIADNGVGLPAGFNINQCEPAGMRLITGLSKQMGAIFTIHQMDEVMIEIALTDFDFDKLDGIDKKNKFSRYKN